MNKKVTVDKIKEMLKETYEAGYGGSIELIDDEVDRIFDNFFGKKEVKEDVPTTPLIPIPVIPGSPFKKYNF